MSFPTGPNVLPDPHNVIPDLAEGIQDAKLVHEVGIKTFSKIGSQTYLILPHRFCSR
jgi:hypothetical protein